jgi:hypothetical protein
MEHKLPSANQTTAWLKMSEKRANRSRTRSMTMSNYHDKLRLNDDAVAKTLSGCDVELAKPVLQLTTENQGKAVPTNGDVPLFGKDRERLFLTCGCTPHGSAFPMDLTSPTCPNICASSCPPGCRDHGGRV